MKGPRAQQHCIPPETMPFLHSDFTSYTYIYYRYTVVQVMELVFQVLSFLYEEEKVPLILSSRRTHAVLCRELVAIRAARHSLTDYLYQAAVREQEERDLLADLASTCSSRSS